jgi:hypothetical protein
MEPEPLFGPPSPAPLAVHTDYGEVEKGASKAHYVLAENGTEYLIKGPSFVPKHPTVAGNEWVAAELATALGLPVLDHCIVSMGGEQFFGSLLMQKGSFSLGIDAVLFGRCANQERVYEIVVFDAWLINKDRNPENLVVRFPRKSGDPHLLILNDHSHLLVSPLEPRTADGLPARLGTSPGPYVSLPFVRESIVSEERLGRALELVESLPESAIRAVVRSTPERLLQDPFRGPYEEFLVERRARLRGVFQANHAVFPNLGR